MTWNRILVALRRVFLCRIGAHTGDQTFCAAGCGACLHPEAFETWRINLRDGHCVEVRAINASHALHQVVYGTDATRTLRRDSKGMIIPPSRVRVHPLNIHSAETVANHAGPLANEAAPGHAGVETC